MSLGKRLFIGEAAAAAVTSETVDIFGDSSGIALYSLDYDASDASGNYDGTPTDVTFGVDGQINWGASFNGSSSYIQTSLSQNSNKIAISFWMEADATGGTSPILMINNRNGVIVPYAYGTGSNSITANTGNQNILLNSTTFTSQWNHIVINMTGWESSYTAGAFGVSINMEVFVNGSSIGTTTNKPYGQSDGTRLGRSNGTYYFDGKLDQVRIFNKALSSSEVSTLYGETATVYTPTTDTNNYQDTVTAYYKFDNSAEDETTNYDGTESNITYEFGRYGTAAVFNGSNSGITTGLGNSQLSVSSAWSCSCWIYSSSFSNATNILGMEDSASPYSGWSLYQSTSAGLQPMVNGNAVGTAKTLTANQWYNVVLTYSGTVLKFYVDGTQIGSDVTISISTPSSNFDIGNLGIYNVYSGKVDQVRIYDSVLDATAVDNLYNEKQAYIVKNHSDPFGDGNSVLLYRFDNSHVDSTGNYDGTKSSGVIYSTDAAVGTHSVELSNGENIHINHSISITNYNFSCAFWMKSTQSDSAIQIVILKVPFFDFVRGSTISGQYSFRIYDGSTVVHSTSTDYDFIHDGNWHHIAATHNGSSFNCYIDGVLVDSVSSSLTSPSITSQNNRIGVRSDGNTANSFNGKIDSFRFFNRALDGDEVFKLYAEVIN